MKVLMVFQAGLHGVLAHVSNLYTRLLRAKHEVILAGITVDEVPLRYHRLNALSYDLRVIIPFPNLASRIKSLCKDVDLVHVHCPLTHHDSFVSVLPELGVPTVATIHYPFSLGNDWWGVLSRFVHHRVVGYVKDYDRVLVTSTAQKMYVEGLRCPQVSYIPNAIDPELYSSGSTKIKDALGVGAIITYIGRLAPEKGIRLLLRSFKELSDEDVGFVVAGRGPSAHQIGGVRMPQLKWLGYVSEELKLEILRSTDIFVLPTFMEGTSVSLLEAMAAGCSVVASRVGGNPDIVSQSSGILVRPGHVGELTAAIRRLLQDQELRLRLGENGRRTVKANFSWEVVYPQIQAIYHAIHRDNAPQPVNTMNSHLQASFMSSDLPASF